MKKYLIRLIRYLLTLIIMIILLLLVSYALQGGSIADLKEVFLRSERVRLFFIIVVAYSLIYPVLVYGKKERYINGHFKDNRDSFVKAFEEQNYVLTKEKDTTMEFRKKSGFSRIISLSQDKIEVDYSGNPVIIEGLRKELSRIDKSLDMNLLRKD